MFKSSLWRSDKSKFKAVFKLNFQATQVPQLKRAALTISLVPEDVGRPTVRLQKAAVRDGTCSWENPIYETVKFTRQSKTGKIDGKIYHFLVSSGSSKAGFLGEVSIDFAEYAEAAVPLTVSLPLTSSHSGAILHVTIQKMQADVDQSRELCQDVNATLTVNTEERITNHQRESLKSVFLRDSNSIDDAYFSETTAQTTDKNGDFRIPIGSSSTLADVTVEQNEPTIDSITSNYNVRQRSSSDWSLDSASEGSITDSTNSPDHSLTRGGEIPETSDYASEKHRSEVFILTRQTELMALELQSLRKQVQKESKKGQDLSTKMITLKEERDAFKDQCERLHNSEKVQFKDEDSRILLEELREEIDHEKNLKANLHIQLEKTKDANADLILAVRELEEMLEHKNRENYHLSSKIETNVCKCKANQDEDQQALEELVRQHDDALEVDFLNHKITELYGEIELHKKDKEDLEVLIKQLNLRNENFNKEKCAMSLQLEHNLVLEAEIKGNLLKALETIKELEIQIQNLENELEKQAEAFKSDLGDMTSDKIEHEQRAIQAEEVLRKTKQNNAITAERLQEEFKKLSIEMASKFTENEKLATNAIIEANELRLQTIILGEKLQKAEEELELIKEQYEIRTQEVLIQIDVKCKEIENMSSELDDKSKQLEYAKMESEKMCEATKMEKDCLRNERDEMKTSISETEMLVQKWNKERDDLHRNYSSAKNEAEKLHAELKRVKDEKETIAATSLSKVESLKVQYDELKLLLTKEKGEKGNLKKEVIQLKKDMKRKDDAIISTERILKKNNGRGTVSNIPTTTSRNNSAVPLPRDSEEVATLKEKLKMLQGQIQIKEVAPERSNDCDLTGLLSEMATLKERNKSMEGELTDMQERYTEISLKFAEVEGERQQLVMTVRNLKSGKKN